MTTSKLQKKVIGVISAAFGRYTIRENIKPEWLIDSAGCRLELDIYMEEVGIAVEVQGVQHYTYIPFFHGKKSGFDLSLSRDRVKREICAQRGIHLLEISSGSDTELSILLDNIRRILGHTAREIERLEQEAQSKMKERAIDMIQRYRLLNKMVARESSKANPQPLRIAKLNRKIEDLRKKLMEIGIDGDYYIVIDKRSFANVKPRRWVKRKNEE